MNRICAAVAAYGALLAGGAAAGELDGCWKMVEARVERQSGKVEASKPDCIRAYQGATLVTACGGGKDVSVYALTDMTVATYSFAPAGRAGGAGVAAPARAAAFRVVGGSTLYMVLGKTTGADPIVRTEQRLTRLPPKECAGLASHLPRPGA